MSSDFNSELNPTNVPYNQRDAYWLIDQQNATTNQAETPQLSLQEQEPEKLDPNVLDPEIVIKYQAELSALKQIAADENRSDLFKQSSSSLIAEIEAKLSSHDRAIEAQQYQDRIAKYNQALRERREVLDKVIPEAMKNFQSYVTDLVLKSLPPLEYSYQGQFYEIKPDGRRDRAEARTAELGKLYKEFDSQILRAAAQRESANNPTDSEVIKSDVVIAEIDDPADQSAQSDWQVKNSAIDSETTSQEISDDKYDEFFRLLDPSHVDEKVRPLEVALTPNEELKEQVETEEVSESSDGYEAYFELLSPSDESTDDINSKEPTNNESANTLENQRVASQPTSLDKADKSLIGKITNITKSSIRRLKEAVDKAKNLSLKTQISVIPKVSRTVYDWAAKHLGKKSWEELSDKEQRQRRLAGLGATALALSVTFYELLSGDSSHRPLASEAFNHLMHGHTAAQTIHNSKVANHLTTIKAHNSADKTALTAANSTEFRGINLNTAYPWTVAHAIDPTNPNAALNEAAKIFQQKYGTNYVLTPYNGTIMFMNGPHAINPVDQFRMNEILAELTKVNL